MEREPPIEERCTRRDAACTLRRAVAPWLIGLAFLAPPAASAATRLEQDVLVTLNLARADPIGYAAALKRYRAFYHGKIIVRPHDPVHRLTSEGVAPLDEALVFLIKVGTASRLSDSTALALGAADHVREQSASGAVGHFGRDGSSPADRLRAHGGGTRVGEVIGYGAADAADVVRQLVVDDGVPGRGHRTAMFDPAYRFAGVACGAHPVYRTMCVIDLSPTWNGDDPARATLARAQAGTSNFVASTAKLLESVKKRPK